jgi:hypothetical protein
MGWVSQSSYIFAWGNGGGVTQRSRDLKPTPPLPEPPVDDDGTEE